ncbi:MAG TPA: hypothetical protein VEC06_02660 [Paucimonas sp.]|nr:hypothetical protein [Paucimonas sp.]
MNTKNKIVASLLLACAATAAFAAKDKHDDATAARSSSNEPLLKVTFSTSETQAIRTYYRTEESGKQAKPLPPGLQKKVARGGQLPPGWQKKLARGEVMSPELYGLAKPAPVALIRQLPPQPPGTIIVHLEGKIVRLIQATHEIIDILDL